MARQRPALAVFGTDGPMLAAIVDALCDLYDLLDERLPAPSGSGGPVRVSEPAPAGPPSKAVPASEPAPDEAPDPDADRVDEPSPDISPPPPRAGKGSSLPAWTSWAQQARVTVSGGMSRDDIINACVFAGVLNR